MNMPHFTAAALDAPSDAAASDCQQSQSRAAPRVVASASTPAPMVGWWAGRSGGRPGPSADIPSLEGPEDESLVGDTLTAFRTALRRAENVDSAADLNDDDSASRTGSDPESLDYFAPAFRRALGAGETEGSEETGMRTRTPTESTQSLDYFQASFRRALGTDASVEAGEGPEGSGTSPEPPSSLDYFAPAFRRALGGQERTVSEEESRCAGDGSQGVVQRFRTIMEHASQRTRLKIADVFRSGLDLDRISDGLFGGQSRDLVMEGR